MCMKDQGGQVFRSCNRTRWDKNGEEKFLESSRLASTKECERYTEVFKIGKLLQTIC